MNDLWEFVEAYFVFIALGIAGLLVVVFAFASAQKPLNAIEYNNAQSDPQMVLSNNQRASERITEYNQNAVKASEATSPALKQQYADVMKSQINDICSYTQRLSNEQLDRAVKAFLLTHPCN